jgi:Fe-S cluster biogenesis protein NfuA
MIAEAVVQRIEQILEELRPAIQKDGGDIQFVSFENGVVSLRLHGACSSCPMSFYTLKLGIQERLVAEIPQVREVIAVD